MFKNTKPIFVENSAIPKILSKLAPIDINAITLGCVVFSRGIMSPTTRRHETIHFQQYLETLFLGFIFIYAYDYLKLRIKGVKGREAYLRLRAEQEAWTNHEKEDYLSTRKRWGWLLLKT